MSRNDQISVIVPTKDRPRELKRFLNSLDVQSLLPNELIIVDASENENTFSIINGKKNTSKYKIKYIKSKSGLTQQKNIGVKESNGNVLFFFDDDVVIDRKFVEVINNSFTEFEELNVAGISGRITNINLSYNFIDSFIKKAFFLTANGKGKVKLSGLPEHSTGKKLSFVNVLPGGCTAYSKKVFSHYQFDENLTGYCYLEDIDFSYRVSQKFGLLYQPLAKCEHFATTFKNANSRTLRRMLVRNHLYLFKKNIPMDICHLYAFGMSLIGLLINNGIMLKDINACIGIIEGLMNPLRTTT